MISLTGILRNIILIQIFFYLYTRFSLFLLHFFFAFERFYRPLPLERWGINLNRTIQDILTSQRYFCTYDIHTIFSWPSSTFFLCNEFSILNHHFLFEWKQLESLASMMTNCKELAWNPDWQQTTWSLSVSKDSLQLWLLPWIKKDL